MLDVVFCVPCNDCRGRSWARIVTNRVEKTRLNDLSWELAYRIVPKLLARYGQQVPAGFWASGVPVLLD